MMKLVRLRLRNIKAFRSLDLSFSHNAKAARPWTLLLGDNASGKTTILRCLAIGMNDESSAAGLVREMKTSFVGSGTSKPGTGAILVGLVDASGNSWTLKTVLERIPRTGDRVRQRAYRLPAEEVSDGPFSDRRTEKGLVKVEEFPYQKLFVCGYGAGRSIDGREEYSEYRNVDAVYTLFRYDQPLQSPTLAWHSYRLHRRKLSHDDLETSQKRADAVISNLLGRVMDPSGNVELELRPDGIYIKHRGRHVPLSDHADGYRSISTWLLDFMAWHILFGSGAKTLRSLKGIVLVDEVEQHLHPRWQRYLVSRLHDLLPNVQFVATTHSPLCAASAADLTSDDCSIIRLKLDEKLNQIFSSELSLPYGRGADDILMSSAFGLADTRNPQVGDRLAEFRSLFKKRHPSAAERRRMRELTESISDSLPELLSFQIEENVAKKLKTLVARAERLGPDKKSK